MEMFESKNDLSCIEPSSTFTEVSLFTKMKEKFTAVQKIDYEVESFRSLECVMQLHYEWVVQLLEDQPFDFGVRHLVLSQNHVFLKSFHGKNLLIVSLLNKVDFPEGTSAYYFDNVKVFHRHCNR